MASFADRLPPALRGLLRQRRFTVLAVVSLGVAIALNTTMYSVTDALLFPKVAIKEPENLYTIPFYGDYKARIPLETRREFVRGMSFYESSALRMPSFRATNMAERGGRAQSARVYSVSENYFDLLGVKPMSGRAFTEADKNSPAHPVVVSERFWRQMFPDRSGTPFDTATFLLDGDPRTVVGLLAYESDFPGEMTDIWQLPQDAITMPWGTIYRLKPGLSLEAAFAELNALALQMETLAGDGPKNARFDLNKVMRDGPMRVQGFHIAVIGAVAFVLLVACFNLANLQFARGLSRTREIATRAAVGATRGQLIGLLVSESAWVALGGVLLGVILTFWGIHIVKSQLPPSLESFLIRPQVSWRLFVFATLSGGLALSIVGLWPALRVSRVDVNELLKSGAGTGKTKLSRWQAGGLVVVQVSLALALMTGASLLIRAAVSLYQLDINPLLTRIVTATVNTKAISQADGRTMADVSNQAVGRALTVPGVEVAATSRGAAPQHKVVSVSVDGGLPREIPTGLWGYRMVSDAFLRAYGTEMLKGRDFRPGETAKSVIIDAQTAKYFWPSNDPIGRQIKFGSDNRHDADWFTVVGVAKYRNTWTSFRTANQAERTEPALGSVYVLASADTAHLPKGSNAYGAETVWLNLTVRVNDKPERMPTALERGLNDASTGMSVLYAKPLFSTLSLDESRGRQNFVAGMFTTFALIALGLAALGVYSVVSHTVSQRTREIGVRLALGASERAIRQSVMFHGNVMVLCGIGLGLVIGLSTMQYLSRFLNGLTQRDFYLFPVSAVALFLTTLAASYIPARRAMRINPVEALRHE